jgi:hypothetical protein
MRFFDVVLCLGLFTIAGFIVRSDIQDFRTVRKFETVSKLPDIPVPLRFVRGYDGQSHPISTLPLGFKRLVVFVIHGANFKEEVDFWNRIKDENAVETIEFVGVCDDSNCIKTLTMEPGKLRFSSVVFGDYRALRGLLDADAQGHMFILDRETGAIRSVGYPKSTSEFAQLRAVLAEGL